MATKLQLAGHDVALVHGEHRSPEDVLGQLRESNRFPSIYPLMISIPSFYALPWAQVFCKLARAVDPNCRITAAHIHPHGHSSTFCLHQNYMPHLCVQA
ncbi:TPA: hypothetical protein ACT5B2_001364 [Burkholderia cenocepacia]|uniref:hypothetical protein n=1 Tax=Burkholderia cenocepacia TaxID=95486 RepID=UPI002AB6F302|nr:hypothetical protein [Burkholderia cenocepacia]